MLAANPRIVEARVSSCSVPYAEGVETRRDPCAVEASGLAAVLEEFVIEFGTRRGTSAGPSQQEVVTGAVEVLVRRTQDADLEGIGVSEKTIRSVLRGSYRTTELRTADALVTAARRTNAFHDGSLVIIPNPRAAAAVRGSCCGASGVGAGGAPAAARAPRRSS